MIYINFYLLYIQINYLKLFIKIWFYYIYHKLKDIIDYVLRKY